jgi:hypothetical protein
MGEAVFVMNYAVVVGGGLVLSRSWSLASLVVMCEVGWILIASAVALTSFGLDDASLVFVGITIVFVSTVELSLGLALAVVFHSSRGRVA